MNDSCKRKDCGYRMVCTARRNLSACTQYDTAKASPFVVAVNPTDGQKSLFPVYPDNELSLGDAERRVFGIKRRNTQAVKNLFDNIGITL